ncbi:MAG TPA: hypothetical protein VFQ91_23630 [Bryobacteraceae bacterium]|nr:hypothetical protein [Bryobacteraceae bacterium]
MSNQGEVRYGLESLYLFPYYQTREDYQKATGHEPPKWDSTRPPKYWTDPTAKDSLRRNITYDQVIAYTASGAPIFDENGNPTTELMMLYKEDAIAVNIPPKGIGTANIEGADVPEVPPPLRALKPEEELFVPFGSIIAVRIKGTLEPDRGFTEEDRTLLLQIARKLGV